MHELGIAFYVLDEAKKIAKENDASRITSITVEIGEVTGIIPSYFEDVRKWAVNKDEITKDCKLDMIIIKATTYCEDCGNVYETVKYGKICPKCKSEHTYLKTGRETILKEMEVE